VINARSVDFFSFFCCFWWEDYENEGKTCWKCL